MLLHFLDNNAKVLLFSKSSKKYSKKNLAAYTTSNIFRMKELLEKLHARLRQLSAAISTKLNRLLCRSHLCSLVDVCFMCRKIVELYRRKS